MQSARLQNITLREKLAREIDAGREIYLSPRLRSLHLYLLQTDGMRRTAVCYKKHLNEQRNILLNDFPTVKFSDIPPGVFPSIWAYKKAIRLNCIALEQYMRARSAYGTRRRMVPSN